jgi:SAM-dependent methyltransferase
MDPGGIVAAGYDSIADRYREWTAPHDPTRSWFVDAIVARVPAGGAVLEVGCGSGVPIGVALAVRYRYRGIDVSARQIELAQASIPGADLRVSDLRTLEVPPASLDAVVAAYVMGHVPIGDRRSVYRRVARWLRPGGWWCTSLPTGDDPGEEVEPDWLGTPMFFASMPWGEERKLIEDAGLAIEVDEIRVDEEDGRPAAFRWVFARRD